MHLRQHHHRVPALFELREILGTLVLAALAHVIHLPFLERSHLIENHLRDAPSDHQGDGVVLGIVGHFHRPAVEIAHIAPAGILAHFHEIPAHGRARVHLGHAYVPSADEFLGMRENGLLGSQENDLRVLGDVLELQIQPFEKRFHGLRLKRSFPHPAGGCLIVQIMDSGAAGGRLLPPIPFAQGHVITRGFELLVAEGIDDYRALHHMLQDLVAG